MAIRIERSGARMVAVQRRRPLGLAALGLAVLVVVGAAATLLESHEAEETRARDHARVSCRRADGTCEVTRGPDRSVMRIETLRAVAAETDGEGASARVMAVIARRHGLPNYHLCEAPAADSEAAGIRTAATELGRFVSDRRVESVEVACQTRRPAAPAGGSVAGRLIAQTAGGLLMLLALLLFLVEIRTEIDRDAGVVRIRGWRAVPPRRWAIERPIGEVKAVECDTRGWGGARSFTVYLRLADGSTVIVFSPVTGWRQKVGAWMDDLRKALGLPPTPSTS